MHKKRSFICAMLAAMTILSGCGGGKDTPADPVETTEQAAQTQEITLWTFPVGNWGNLTSVTSLIASFQREHPDIHVNVE